MLTTTDDVPDESDVLDPDDADAIISAAVANSLASGTQAHTVAVTAPSSSYSGAGSQNDQDLVIDLAQIWSTITRTQGSQSTCPKTSCRKRLRSQSPSPRPCKRTQDPTVPHVLHRQTSPPEDSPQLCVNTEDTHDRDKSTNRVQL